MAAPVNIDEVDTANVDLCPGGCGTLVRRFSCVPISGSGLDLVFAGPWWCPACLKAKCVQAVAECSGLAGG